MPLCLQQNPDGTLAAVAFPPADISACSLVAMSGAEFVSVQASPWNLTPEQGSQIGGSILLCWAIAWTWRLLADLVRSLSFNETHQE